MQARLLVLHLHYSPSVLQYNAFVSVQSVVYYQSLYEKSNIERKNSK